MSPSYWQKKISRSKIGDLFFENMRFSCPLSFYKERFHAFPAMKVLVLLIQYVPLPLRCLSGRFFLHLLYSFIVWPREGRSLQQWTRCPPLGVWPGLLALAVLFDVGTSLPAKMALKLKRFQTIVGSSASYQCHSPSR